MSARRRTFSVTMTDELREALDQMVKSRRFQGRSHAIEYYVKRGLEEEEKERKFREERERGLSKILEKDVEKIAYLVEFVEAFERNPELIERMKGAIQAQSS